MNGMVVNLDIVNKNIVYYSELALICDYFWMI